MEVKPGPPPIQDVRVLLCNVTKNELNHGILSIRVTVSYEWVSPTIGSLFKNNIFLRYTNCRFRTKKTGTHSIVISSQVQGSLDRIIALTLRILN